MSPKMFCWVASLLGSLVGCASVPAPVVHPRGMTPAEEALAIEAAKRHPIAHPEPRSLYPEQSPPPFPVRGMPTEAPPPLESAHASEYPGEAPPDQPAPMQSPALEAEPSEPPPVGAPIGQASPPTEPRPTEPPSGNLVAPSPPPADYADAPRTPAPSPSYVWAPGYWSWSGTGYLWVVGDWLPDRPGYTYVRPSWTRSSFGWEFGVGGWSRGGTGVVSYPVYRHPYGPPAYQAYRWPDSYPRSPGAYRYERGRQPATFGERFPEPSYPGPQFHGEVYAAPRAPIRQQSEPHPSTPRVEAPAASPAPHVTRAIPARHDGHREAPRASEPAR